MKMNPIFYRLTDAQVLALTITLEAGGEPDAGKIGVGTVILERVDHRNWDGRTIKEVCLNPSQFSCFLESERTYKRALAYAERFDDHMATVADLNGCYGIAVGMLDGSIPRDPELAATNCCQYIEGSFRRAMDKKLEQARQLAEKGDTHLKKEYEKLRSKCWWTRMRLLKVIGRHEFYV